MNISGDFTFHSIGQGLFYSGVIDIDGIQRRIVYDCGSFCEKEHLEYKIDKAFAENCTIDLLMISHMDEDHVNGISYLLNRVSCVNLLLMPYMEPEELAFLAMKYESGRDKNSHRDYIDSILDFENIISDEKIRNIVMLTDLSNDDDSPIVKIDLPEDIWFKFQQDKEKQKKLDQISQKKRRIHVAKHNGELKFSGGWKFRFYVWDEGDKNRKNFHEDLVRNGLKISTFAALRDVWNSKEQIAKLKKSYKSIKEDLNLASLILFHKPLGEDRFLTKVYPLDNCVNSRNFFDILPCMACTRESLKIGTILLGDAKLSSDEECKKLADYFSDDLLECVVSLVPHHGSKHSWHKGLLERVISNFWVVSYGVNGKYGHPDTKVMNDLGVGWGMCPVMLESIYPRVLFCNEYKRIKYFITSNG